jgi:CHAD domain-containing protein
VILLRPSTPRIRLYAAEQVSNLLGRLVFLSHRAARSHDAEAIHDLRVSIRRFNQGARAFGQFFPPRAVKRIRRRLREVMDLAALVRDRDVALELCAEAGLAESAPLCRALATQRTAAARELRTLLKRFEVRDYSSRWRARLRL